MKNLKVDVYNQIKKDRDSSYGFLFRAPLDQLRMYNEIIKRNRSIFEQVRIIVYRDINLIIKNEANIHATNR